MGPSSASCAALNSMGDRHGNHSECRSARDVEQGQDRRAKAPFKVKDIWALRVRLQMDSRIRELALFNLGIDSKLRGCDLVALRVRDVCHGDQAATRAIVMQHRTQRPVQFEITQATRDALQAWIKQAGLKPEDYLFPSRLHSSPHLGTRQYARILGHWVDELGLEPPNYGDALNATYKGDADLPAHEEPSRRAAVAGALQTRVDGAVPVACCRFQRHLVKVEFETGGGRWEPGGSSAGSTSSRR